MSRIYVSVNAYQKMIDALCEEGHLIAFVRPCKAVSEPISMHPDICIIKMGSSLKSPVFAGNTSLLGPEYPNDVLYNAVVTERFFICNKKTVSRDIVKTVDALYPDIRTIHVKQGYTKCNTVVVDENHFITEDEGIFKALDATEGAECLLVERGHVILPGHDRGFIGGASGRIGNDIWFNGDIEAHPDWAAVKSFIEDCGLGIRYVPGKPLLDIGSIIEEYIG